MRKTIIIELTDNPSDIRNEGMGDYYELPNGNKIVKAYMKDENSYNYAFLIAIHELIEMRLTEHRGIKEEDINTFDKWMVDNGELADVGGDHPLSPYAKEHRFAENIERLLCHELGLNWNEYYDNYQI